jgi:peptidoglycan hydrolase CwlO-like protein
MNKKIVALFVIMFIIIAIQGMFIYQVTRQVNNISSDVDITDLNRRVRGLERKVSSNETEIFMLDGRISDVEGRLDNIFSYLNAGLFR